MKFNEELKKVEEILALYGREEDPEEYVYRLTELCTLARVLEVPQLCEYIRGLFEQWIREGKSKGYILEKLKEWSKVLSDKAHLLREMAQEERKSISSFDELRRLEIPPTGLSVTYATVIKRGNFGRLYLKIDNNSAFRALVTGISFDGGVKLALPLGFVEVMPHNLAFIEKEVLLEGNPSCMVIAFQQGGAVRRMEAKVTVKEVKEAVSYKEYLGSPIEALKRVEKVERCERLTIRERFGKWEAYCLLGGGGYGVAYLARHRDELAVVKIAKEGSDSKRAIKREYEILSKARDLPGNVRVHVAEIIEYGINAKGLPYIVLKYYPRGNLFNVAGRLSPRDALIVLLQIGGTLIEFYQRGILKKHGDLKPENILIDEEGRSVITDFGAALEAGRITDKERPTTPGYGCDAEDSRADVYALGRLLVDMLVGIKAREEDVPYPLDKLVKAARKKRGELCNPEGILKMEEFIKMAEDLLPLL